MLNVFLDIFVHCLIDYASCVCVLVQCEDIDRCTVAEGGGLKPAGASM